MRRSTTALALAATLLISAPAANALPAGRSGLYGGGAVRDYLQFVSLAVKPSGAFDASATLVTNCSPRFGDSLTESVSLRGQRLSARGRYGATRSFSDRLDPGVPTVGGLRAEGATTFSVAVRGGGRAGVLGAGRADGLVRVRTTYIHPDTGEEVARCDTGAVRWEARRPLPDAGSGTPGPEAWAGRPRPWPGTYRGTTAGDRPFLMRVADDGRLVRRAGLTVRIGCPSGIGLPLDVVAHRVPIRRGRFLAGNDFRRSFVYPDGTEVAESYSWVMSGRFAEHGARGSFRMRGVVRRRSDGTRLGSCGTGPIAWRAAR